MIRCDRCLNKLKEEKYDGDLAIFYCDNKECDVEDGIYKDKANMLEYGKNELVVHMPTYKNFIDDCSRRDNRENEVRKKIHKEETSYQDKYYNSFDYRIIERIKSLISSVKNYINERPSIIKYREKK